LIDLSAACRASFACPSSSAADEMPSNGGTRLSLSARPTLLG
jgi:hypothetical protein